MTVHFIWLGSRLPNKYLRNINSFKKHGYKVKLWTEPLKDMVNKDLFDRATTYALKADILRLEILYQEGGLYCDVDARMLKKIDLPSSLVLMTTPNGFYGNETMYAVKGHLGILKCIQGLSKHVEGLKECNIWDIAGATYITPILSYYDNYQHPITMIGRYGTHIRHEYDGSWKTGLVSKAEKKPLSYWIKDE